MIHVSRELSKLSLLRHFDAGSYTLEEITWSRRDQNSHKSTSIIPRNYGHFIWSR